MWGMADWLGGLKGPSTFFFSSSTYVGYEHCDSDQVLSTRRGNIPSSSVSSVSASPSCGSGENGSRVMTRMREMVGLASLTVN